MVDLEKYELKPEEMRRIVKIEEIAGENVPEMPIEFIGQQRAIKALKYVLSPEGNKSHVVMEVSEVIVEPTEEFIQKELGGRKANGEIFQLKDWCYVHNFDDPRKPRLLHFSPGDGSKFRTEVWGLIDKLLNAMENIPREIEIRSERIVLEIIADENAAITELFDKLEKEKNIIQRWSEKGWKIFLTRNPNDAKRKMINWGPIKDPATGDVYNEQEAGALPPEIQTRITQTWAEIEQEANEIENIVYIIRSQLEREYRQRIEKLTEELTEMAVEPTFRLPLFHYGKYPKAIKFLEELKKFVKSNKTAFLPTTGPTMDQNGKITETVTGPPPISQGYGGLPFQINLFVDNSGKELPPVIVETSTTYPKLFGKLERKMAGQMPAMEIDTNHMMLKPGALHLAQNGYLILYFTKVFIYKPVVFQGLDRVMEENQIKILDPVEEYGDSFPGKSLSPEPMPLELKVIILAHPALCDELWRHPILREFMKRFQIKAEFDRVIDCTPDNVREYAAWMNQYCQKKNFLAIESEAKTLITEHLLRETGSQEKLLWDIEGLKALIKESQSYARMEGSNKIKRSHVVKTIEEQTYRSNLHEEKERKAIIEGKIAIETNGKKIGQINGLLVAQPDNYAYAIPGRITVSTYRGEKGLVDIEKKAGFAGRMHAKATETLVGFFYERYGQNKEINFEGKISIEQIWEDIDGPSASMADTFALVSSLAKIPIKQSIAVTGTVDKKGLMGAIGAVNQKIEGFYEICKARGLTGEQGVIIPRTNVKNLMLKEEVVGAVKEGKFHVYAIENFEEGMEILTGRPIKEIDKLVNRKLAKWSKKSNSKEKS